VSVAAFTIAVVVGLMLAERRVSERHERALLDRGARAPAEPGYLLMAVLYPACFVAMGIEGALRHLSVTSVFVAGALMCVAAKALKYWAIATLGERWTFKVHVLPRAPLVRSGPYRYVAHPNYIGVMGELVGVAMMTDARVTGPVAVVSFAFVLWRRIAFEERVLRDMRIS
jgi:methyltransferase